MQEDYPTMDSGRKERQGDWVEAQKLTMKKPIAILGPLKLPDSSVQSVIETLLPSKLPLVNKRTLVYFEYNVPHLILPC